LLLSQNAVCDALGGRWIAREDACNDGFGGNGNNDPGERLGAVHLIVGR